MRELILQSLPEIMLSAALFLALWAFLGNYVFKPYFALLARREARTTGDHKLAQERNKQAEALLEKVEAELYQARLRGIRHRDEQSAAAKTQAQHVLDEAATRAAEKLDEAREELQILKVQARRQLEEETRILAKSFVNKMLAQTSSQTVH